MGSFSTNTSANETNKFVESQVHPGVVALAVSGPDGSNLSGGIWDLPFDAVTVTYPNATTEVYSSRQGGVSGSIQEVVTVIYTDSTKENITSVEKT